MPHRRRRDIMLQLARRFLVVAGAAVSVWLLPACSAVESFGGDVSRLGTAGRQWIADVGGDDPRVDSDY